MSDISSFTQADWGKAYEDLVKDAGRSKSEKIGQYTEAFIKGDEQYVLAMDVSRNRGSIKIWHQAKSVPVEIFVRDHDNNHEDIAYEIGKAIELLLQ